MIIPFSCLQAHGAAGVEPNLHLLNLRFSLLSSSPELNCYPGSTNEIVCGVFGYCAMCGD